MIYGDVQGCGTKLVVKVSIGVYVCGGQLCYLTSNNFKLNKQFWRITF